MSTSTPPPFTKTCQNCQHWTRNSIETKDPEYEALSRYGWCSQHRFTTTKNEECSQHIPIDPQP